MEFAAKIHTLLILPETKQGGKKSALNNPKKPNENNLHKIL
jgi:hypothetical protein